MGQGRSGGKIGSGEVVTDRGSCWSEGVGHLLCSQRVGCAQQRCGDLGRQSRQCSPATGKVKDDEGGRTQ